MGGLGPRKPERQELLVCPHTLVSYDASLHSCARIPCSMGGFLGAQGAHKVGHPAHHLQAPAYLHFPIQGIQRSGWHIWGKR